MILRTALASAYLGSSRYSTRYSGQSSRREYKFEAKRTKAISEMFPAGKFWGCSTCLCALSKRRKMIGILVGHYFWELRHLFRGWKETFGRW